MQRRIIFFLVVLVLANISRLDAQFTHAGAGISYGTNIKELGLSVYGIYAVNEKIRIAPNVTYFLPRKELLTEVIGDYEEITTWWVINLDGHYMVFRKGSLGGYGLMGLNVTGIITEKNYDPPNEEFDDKRSLTKLGLNIGAGGEINISDRIYPFAEVKYTLGEPHQFCISGGLRIRFAPDKERIEEE